MFLLGNRFRANYAFSILQIASKSLQVTWWNTKAYRWHDETPKLTGDMMKHQSLQVIWWNTKAYRWYDETPKLTGDMMKHQSQVYFRTPRTDNSFASVLLLGTVAVAPRGDELSRFVTEQTVPCDPFFTAKTCQVRTSPYFTSNTTVNCCCFWRIRSYKHY